MEVELFEKLFEGRLEPYEGPCDPQQSPDKPGRMDNDEHLKIFLQPVEEEVNQTELK